MHTRTWMAVSAALAIIGGGVVVAVAEPGRVLDRLSTLDVGWLTAAIALEVVAVACLAQVHRRTFAAAGGRVATAEALPVALGALALARTVPAGGAVGGVYAARRLARHGDPAAATAAVVLYGLVTMAALVAVVATGALVGVGSGELSGGAGVVTLGLLTLAAASLAAVAGLLRAPGVRRRLVDVARRPRRWPQVDVAAVERALTTLAEGPTSSRHVLAAGSWAAVAWALDVAILAAVLVATGAAASPAVVILAHGAVNALNAVPVSPGGAGIVEAGLAGALVALGTDAASASVAALGYRAVSTWLPVTVAAAAVLSSWHASEGDRAEPAAVRP